MNSKIAIPLSFYLLSGIYCALLVSCNTAKEPYSIREIKEGWMFRCTSGDTTWQEATVPGTVHQDLLALKQIPDPFVGTNEREVQWIENADWEYQTFFNVDDESLGNRNIDLVFEGLDTYASIYLNDSLVLETDNMYRTWKIPIKNHAIPGKNSLRIIFHSPITEGMEKLKAIGYALPANGEQAPISQRTSSFTRKAPFHYGWDWAPRLVTSGIWQPVSIHVWESAHIEHFYLKQQKITAASANYTLMLDVIAEDEGSLQAILYINNKRSSTKTFKAGSGNNRFLLDFEIENPRLWWTNGLGEPYLYDLRIQLMQENNILHEKKHRLGVRTLELVQEQDNIGESFYFKLNGIPVFMKGADYVPSDILTPRVSDEIYKNLIRTVVESNMNMLRICGCSIYEKDIFYDLCDENGILVWQDFMFANMMSPPQPEHLENIRKEAEDNIIRIRNHPCLALWCGNNEIKVGWNNWNWKKQYGYSAKDSAELWNTYEQIFHGILPLAIAEYDPDRFYHPTSPPIFFHETSARLSGDQHDWGVWFDELPIESYSVTIGRFVSEYGMQSYPSLKTIKTFAGSADLDMNSPVMRLRQKCKMDNVRPGFDGNDMIMRYIVNYYKAPKDFGSMVYLSQLIQAESVKNAISAHRRNMPRCMGSLYWQINDCWPAISWASLDYFQDWKASQFAVRDKFAPVIPSLVKGNDKKIQLYVISDRLDTIQGVIVLSLTDFNGKELWTMEQKKDIKPNGSELVFEDIKLHGHDLDSSSSCLIARIYTGEVLLAEDFFYFRLPKDLNLTKPVIYKEIRKVENGYEITVSGDRLIKNIYLELPEKQGKFSDNFFDLPKGMRKKIHLMTKDPGLDIEDVKIMSLADTY